MEFFIGLQMNVSHILQDFFFPNVDIEIEGIAISKYGIFISI